MLLGLYQVTTGLAAPFLNGHLRRRARRGKEDAARLAERFGQASLHRPEGPLLWIHAASVGEALSALPLIHRLLDHRPVMQILMTTGTVTSAELMAARLPPRTRHQFAPVDRAAAWRRFFAHWRPDLGLLVEQEIWPNLILEARHAGLPLALINGRMSARSAGRWRWAAGSVAWLLGSFALCLARSDADAERFRSLGAGDVRMLGDLKTAAAPLPADAEGLARLRAAVGDRPVWLAASTHPGEEVPVLHAHRALRAAQADLLTIIAPRHPERGGAMADELRAAGETTICRSSGRLPGADTAIYLADTLGELGIFYRLAGVALIGGSLVPHGGQNPLEAARLGCLPLFGPHTGNFEMATDALLRQGAAKRVWDADALGQAVGTLLDDPAGLDAMATKARQAAMVEEPVLERIAGALEPLLIGRFGPTAGAEQAVGPPSAAPLEPVDARA